MTAKEANKNIEINFEKNVKKCLDDIFLTIDVRSQNCFDNVTYSIQSVSKLVELSVIKRLRNYGYKVEHSAYADNYKISWSAEQ